MVKHSFEICGITVSDTEKVRNADKRCMKDALESSGNEVEEKDDDPFILEIVRKWEYWQKIMIALLFSIFPRPSIVN